MPRLVVFVLETVRPNGDGAGCYLSIVVNPCPRASGEFYAVQSGRIRVFPRHAGMDLQLCFALCSYAFDLHIQERRDIFDHFVENLQIVRIAE